MGGLRRRVRALLGGRETAHALRMPSFPAVDVSIVIAARSGAPARERCLRAIVSTGDAVAFEAIVVDGGAAAANRGVMEARGRYVVLLDDDVEVRLGWLTALVARADSRPDIGVVAAKLLRSDGNLAEAGGIVWQSGDAAGFGDGQRRDAPEYDYSRAVDHGASAALLVRRELWDAVGGLDGRYESDRYVAADLAFAARAAGWMVVYEPRAEVARGDGAATETDQADLAGRRERDRQAFAAKWGAALEAQPVRGEWSDYLASNRDHGPHVLIVDHSVPTPDRDAGSLRMSHVLDTLAELGCRVTFLPDGPVADDRYRRSLQDASVEVLEPGSELAAYLAAAGGRTRLAILSRPYVASRYLHIVREHAPGARVAYDTVDLHYVREHRRAEVEGNPNRAKAAGLRELELALARACDVTLTVSEAERQTLLAEEPGLDVAILPNVHEPWSEVPPRGERSGVLFVGGFAHGPNVGAALELAREVMPAVWAEIEDVRLTVVGADPPPELAALADDRIDVRGWVPDLAPLLGGSVAMAVPLRYGAGVKGKVTQSMSAGLPVVTTVVGAEGLAVEHGREILVGDTAGELARLIVELYRDADLWSRISVAGREEVARTASPAALRPVLERLLAP
ncbi:MAG TPA: glycosyltransferase [Thermoleophilaceae bacterium]|nr:glycosyltransferase [Thermoleophilaceae bacterium]